VRKKELAREPWRRRCREEAQAARCRCGRGGGVIGAEETGTKRCGRGGRGAVVEETGTSHPGGVGSGAEGTGPNTGSGSGSSADDKASTGNARIRVTLAEQARVSGRATVWMSGH
jgi:hypothetical protein